jgi:hypothetical protein
MIAFTFLILNNSTVSALEHLPGQTEPSSPLGTLESISANDKYISCYSDLKQMVANLKDEDFESLKKMAVESKGDKANIMQILSHGTKGLTKAKPSYDSDMQSAHALVDHKGFKCQLSIYSELEMDQIKVNIDPRSTDQKIAIGDSTIEVESTLIGASYNSEDKIFHFDPSKALTLIQRQIPKPSLEQSIKILQEFQMLEDKSNRGTTNPATGVN